MRPGRYALCALLLWVACTVWAADSDTGRTGVGYGYLWWIGLNGGHFGVKFPGKVVSARGHRGQFVVVDMARDIVVVHKVMSERDSRTAVNDREFGALLKLIMEAKS